MKLFELLELLDQETPVWIATGERVETDPEAELVAHELAGELKLRDISGYEVVCFYPEPYSEGVAGIAVIVKEVDT